MTKSPNNEANYKSHHGARDETSQGNWKGLNI